MVKQKKTFPELTKNEKKLLETVAKGSVREVIDLLKQKDVKIDCLDETGMTPLQHAAFKGNCEVADYLLSAGADVNSNHHENDYGTLMFAALSGNAELTRLMLKYGAKKDKLNSVGRNASQMAAFVGQHQCVSVINNYYADSDLDHFTQIQGQDKEPKLPDTVKPGVLKLLNMANMHPVKVSLHYKHNPIMLTESSKVCKVLDMICERAMKARDTDDVMAMKAHYFATVLRKAKDQKDIDTWIKQLMVGRAVDGYPELQDQLIRQSLKEFPYIESILLQNMVRQLHNTKIGDSPSSLNILMQAVNGQKFGFDESDECTTCNEPKAKKCTKCKMANYCNRECQLLHWPTHKKFCAKLAVEYKKLEEQKLKNEKSEKEREEKERLEKERKAKEASEKAANDTPATSVESANTEGTNPEQEQTTTEALD